MVGAEECGPSRPLLADYDLGLPRTPPAPAVTPPEPVPLGCAAQAYANAAGQQAVAQFYAAWVAENHAPDRKPIFPAGPERDAAMVAERVGSGGVVLIADTYFATNKNFQAEESEERHNADFWSWLLAGLTGHEPPPGKGQVFRSAGTWSAGRFAAQAARQPCTSGPANRQVGDCPNFRGAPAQRVGENGTVPFEIRTAGDP